MTDTPNRSPLSPAAQAVLGAMGRSYDHEPTRRLIAADVLRALADHQWAPTDFNGPGDRWNPDKRTRQELRNIAADLLERQAAPVPVAERLPGAVNTHFEFIISDADYCTHAGGVAPTYAQALSEGQRYLAQYQQDGPHTLELRRVEVLHPGALPMHPAPVPVSERLPEPNVKVLAYYFNGLGNGRTICAIWVPAKSRSDDVGDDDDFLEYDEEDDKFYWPEGWYEVIENWDDLGWVAVNEGEVAYWQPLPKWPALPLPQGEVE